MHCEGCEHEIGDLKTLRTHRRTCGEYATWSARGAKPIPRIEPQRHAYEGRVIPAIFG
jgi:hypothetical protein